MTLFQKQQKTNGYKTIPDASAADKTAAVPFGTMVQTSTCRRSSTWRIAIVAGMTMIVMAGGAVWMLQTTDGGLTTTAVERIRDNVGGDSCCKKKSKECERYEVTTQGYFDLGYRCKTRKGYDAVCHMGAGVDPSCCTDEYYGTFYPFDFGHGCH